MNIGKMIFYDKITGEKIIDTGQWENVIMQKTVDQQIETYKELSERNRETFDVLELPFGARQQDFAICNDYRVDPTTKEILFSYPDPNEPEVPQVFQQPLSVEVEELRKENTLLKAQNNALTERTDFHEDVLTEIILTIAQ